MFSASFRAEQSEASWEMKSRYIITEIKQCSRCIERWKKKEENNRSFSIEWRNRLLKSGESKASWEMKSAAVEGWNEGFGGVHNLFLDCQV